MIIRNISQQDSNYLKGIAILVIMLHNYFHILDNAPGENEFNFSLQSVLNLLHNLTSAPLDFVKQLFSFWGHYAVQLFVFVSGYGLAKSYSSNSPIVYKTYIINRLKKLYPAFFFAVFFLFCYKFAVDAFISNKDIDLITYVKEAVLKLTLFANLIPGQALTISSPWWFFSLIFQLYLIAPFLLTQRNRYTLWIVIVIAWLIQLSILFIAPEHIDYLRLNFVGHLPEFCLGILLAKQQKVKISSILFMLLIAVFIFGSFNRIVWLVSFTVAPILFLILSHFHNDHGKLSRLLRFFGRNSLYFFAVHGLCRAPFVPLGNQSAWGSWISAILYLIVVTSLTLVFKYLVERITLPLFWQKETS
ncbi:peptidoglycan/LPS O-acetylase OafA/YrhL [Pontibacter aydingkolensis]|uniref:Acyltransferase n=1 Tax=Pontibacter aydingkolensis TaxID=1911536 RepID=A0ABS7CPE8_9BACT|nr:acyltransferase [Pontibacter aydingkolensis]MBW7465688.1 acyltransferase [Pontibacter aydingkolensis]